MEKPKYKIFIFFRNDFFLISRGIQFQSWGCNQKNPFTHLRTTSWSSSEERRLQVLFKGLSSLCRYTGWHLCFTLHLEVHILYFILNWTGSQCRYFNKNVTRQNRAERVTTLAKQFWTLCSLFISRFDKKGIKTYRKSRRLSIISIAVNIPSKHETLNQCWFNVGPASCLLCNYKRGQLYIDKCIVHNTIHHFWTYLLFIFLPNQARNYDQFYKWLFPTAICNTKVRYVLQAQYRVSKKKSLNQLIITVNHFFMGRITLLCKAKVFFTVLHFSAKPECSICLPIN